MANHRTRPRPEEADDYVFVYTDLSVAQIMYLAHKQTAQIDDEILPRIPNIQKIQAGKTGSDALGIVKGTIELWRERHPAFRYAEKRMRSDARWFHETIASPLKLARMDVNDLEAILGLSTTPFKMTARDREMILQEAGHLNGKAPGLGETLSTLMAGIGESMAHIRKPALPEPHAAYLDLEPVKDPS